MLHYMKYIRRQSNYGGESLETVIQMIKDLGFPIACVVALFWQNNHLQEQHREDLKNVTAAINNNTAATLALKQKLEDGEK